MKYCKDELKILPKRLMVFGYDDLLPKPKPGENKSVALLHKILNNVTSLASLTSDHPLFQISKNDSLTEENINEILDQLEDHLFFLDPIDEKITVIPVDDSIGEIEQIVVGYTFTSQDNHTTNAFNKIYVDFIMKLSRVMFASPSSNDFNIYSIAAEDISYSNLVVVNQAIQKLAFFTEKFLKEEDTIKFSGDVHYNNTKIWMQDEMIPVMTQKNGIRESVIYGSNRWEKKKKKKKKKKKENTPGDIISELERERGRTVRAENILPRNMVGGNILFVGKYVLLGYGCLFSASGRPPHLSTIETDRIDRIREIVGKDKTIELIGNQENMLGISEEEFIKYAWLKKGANCQPLFHLDLFINPAGRSESSGKHRVFVGYPMTDLNRKDPVLAQTRLFKKDGIFDWTVSYLDRIANQLSHLGLEVYRIPLPLTWVNLTTRQTEPSRRWMFASYNNCVVQYIGENSQENHVFLPKYSGEYAMENTGYFSSAGKEYLGGDWSELKKYEKQVEELWQRLGFRTIFMTNCLPLLIKRGGLRCMIKVLRRKVHKNKIQ